MPFKTGNALECNQMIPRHLGFLPSVSSFRVYDHKWNPGFHWNCRSPRWLFGTWDGSVLVLAISTTASIVTTSEYIWGGTWYSLLSSSRLWVVRCAVLTAHWCRDRDMYTRLGYRWVCRGSFAVVKCNEYQLVRLWEEIRQNSVVTAGARSWLFLVLSVVYGVDTMWFLPGAFFFVGVDTMWFLHSAFIYGVDTMWFLPSAFLFSVDTMWILPSACFVLWRCQMDSRLVTIDEQFFATAQAISPVQEVGTSHVG